jgi:hypothetical protein
MIYVDIKIAFPEVPDRICKDIYREIVCRIKKTIMVKKPVIIDMDGYWLMESIFKTEDIDIVDSLKEYLRRIGIHDISMKKAETLMLLKAFSKMMEDIHGVELELDLEDKIEKILSPGSYSITIMQVY